MTKLYVTSASSFPRAMNTPNKQKDQNSFLHEKIPLLLASLLKGELNVNRKW